MKKMLCSLLVVALMGVPTLLFSKPADKKKGKKEAVAMTQKDSMSYAVGMEFAKSVKQNLSGLP